MIDPKAQAVMEALVWAVEQTDAARCLITSRYKLTTTQGDLFYQEELSAMRPAEADKKRRGLLAYRDATPDLRERVDRVADGNPRLMEWLDRVLKQKSLDHDMLLKRMEEVENDFRDKVLARELVAGLPEPTRRLLAGMLVYELPVPFAAVTALFPDRGEGEVRDGLAAAAAVGLVEEEPQLGGTVYRVPRLLGPILAADCPADLGPLVDAAASALFKRWWESDYQPTEFETLEIARLGRQARRADVVAPVTAAIGQSWLNQYRYQEASNLYAEAIAAIGGIIGWSGGWARRRRFSATVGRRLSYSTRH